MADDRKTEPTRGHEHHDRNERGRKDATDLDVEERERERDRRAGHETDRSLAT